MSGRTLKILWFVAAVVSVTLCAANLYFGEVNQDEGWYLYAGRMVAEGKFPYIDFAYPQGPVMPFVYVLAQPLVDAFGVAGGRLFSSLLGFVGMALTSLLAARLVSSEKRNLAALLAFIFAGVNVYQSYFLTSVKTYSLCGLFLTLGFFVLTFARGKKAWLFACISGALLALAAGTRISAIVVLPAVFIVLFMAAVQLRKWQDTIDSSGAGAIIGDAATATINPFVWLWFAVGAALAAFVIFIPFVFKAPSALWFALAEYHAGRNTGGLISLLAYKAGFISRMVQVYFVPVALFTGGILYLMLNRGRRSFRSLFSVVGAAPLSSAVVMAIWISVAAVSLVHFSAPFPYEDYQVMIFPLFAAALAVMFSEFSSGEEKQGPGVLLPVMILLLSIASSFSSPMNQAWFAGHRDRIWWPLRQETSLHKLQRIGRMIKSMTRPGDILLTQDVYLAVETGLRLPRGLEMGQFSYFPSWTREKAAACHVLNMEMMLNLLNTVEAPVAAFSGYGLSISSPQITELPKVEQDALWQVVIRRYAPVQEVQDFGQADTTLRILRRARSL